MAQKSMAPFQRRDLVSPRPEEADPFLALRRDMNRMFDDLFRGFGLPNLWGYRDTEPPLLAPRLDIGETDEDIKIAVELPGLDEDDVDITLSDNRLTIRGEKRAEREEEGRDYHVRERVEGSFRRVLMLPFEVEPEQIEAVFRDGVLTITIPKPKEVQEKQHKIEVKREKEAAGAPRQKVTRAAAGSKPSEPGASTGQGSGTRRE